MVASIKKVKRKLGDLPFPVKISVVYIICSILQKGIAFIAVPIYTRLVSPEEYGIYSLYQSWISVLSVFATLHMWKYLYSNGMLKYEERKDDFTSALIGLSSVLTICVFLGFLIFKDWFLYFSGLPLFVVLLMFIEIFFQPSYEYWCSRNRFEYRVKLYAITAIIISFSTPIVSIFLIMIGKNKGIHTLGSLLVFGKMFCSVFVYIIIMLYLLRKSKKVFDKKIWNYALKYNVPLVPHFLSGIILAQSDRIMIGAMCGKSSTAIYSVAYSVASVMLIANSAIMDSIIPWTYKKLRNADYTKLPFISSISLIIVSGVNIIIVICAPEIIALMAPVEYQEAIYIIPPVAISNVFIFMFNLFANIEYFHEETKLVTIASCIAALTNIILNYICIKLFGFIAAGYTTVLCYIIYAFCHYCFMRHVLRKNTIKSNVYNSHILWSISITSLIIALIIVVLYPYFWMRAMLLIIIVIFLVAFRKKFVKIIKDIKQNE